MRQPVTTAPGRRTEVVVDPAEFARLATDWARLYAHAPRATPFQSHSWLLAWWQAYGRPGSLRVFLVWADQRLVAAAACSLSRRGPARVLVPLGGAISDFLDVMVEEVGDDEGSAASVSALVDALQQEGGWDVFDLPEVRAGAAVELLVERWPTTAHRQQSSTCMELPVRNFAELVAGLPTKRAREIRRVLRRSDELDLVVSDVPVAEVGEAVHDLLRLHARQWQDRGGNPEHQRARYAQHLSQSLTEMVEQGQAAVTRYRLEGRVLAGQIVLIGHDLVGGYLLGVDPELYTRMDFSTYVVRADVERALSHGCSTYSLLRGQESYKERWQSVPAVNSRLLLTRASSPLGPAYVLAVRGRGRLVAEAKERAPWLRTVRQRYRDLRARRGDEPRA